MPVRLSTSTASNSSASTDTDREIARLREELNSLRKQKPAEPVVASTGNRLALYLSALALVVAIIALFRH